MRAVVDVGERGIAFDHLDSGPSVGRRRAPRLVDVAGIELHEATTDIIRAGMSVECAEEVTCLTRTDAQYSDPARWCDVECGADPALHCGQTPEEARFGIVVGPVPSVPVLRAHTDILAARG